MESTFEKNIDCEKACFETRAVFEQAIFEGYAKFKDVTFEKPVNFRNAKFRSGADFRYAIFNEKVNFQLTKFFSANFRRAEFEGKADFRKTTYKKSADFNRAKFRFEEEKVNFVESTFSKSVDFSTGVEFSGGVVFDKVEFGGEANFMAAYFKEDSSFFKVDFRGIAEFNLSTFEKDAIFSAAEFHKEAIFEDVKFSIERENDNPNKSRLTNFYRTIFNYPPDFSETEFGGELSFHLTEFSKGVLIKRPHQPFPKENFWTKQAAEEASRIQKLDYEKNGRKKEADKMFVQEMQSRRAQKSKPGKFLEWLVADFTCKYGTSWKRVLGVSALILFGYSIVYWLVSSLTGAAIVFQNGETISSLTLPNLWNSIHYSAVTFTTLGYGNMFPQGFLEFVSDLEAITGAVLMALLVAVFARKWMR